MLRLYIYIYIYLESGIILWVIVEASTVHTIQGLMACWTLKS